MLCIGCALGFGMAEFTTKLIQHARRTALARQMFEEAKRTI